MSEFAKTMKKLEEAIDATPTSELRNFLTDLNIIINSQSCLIDTLFMLLKEERDAEHLTIDEFKKNVIDELGIVLDSYVETP